jgi:hypothetical protein
MTITNTFAAKLAVAFVAVAMVFSAFVAPAKAQTTEDLQKMINDLLAQVAALQSQVGQGGTSVASGVCPYTWTRDLSIGSTGGDVMKLQQFLNADADTRIAASGVGSVGMETEYYGALTAAAVSKMQVKYRADILSPANLVNPTGYFGPSSRAKANALCAVAPVAPTPDPVDDEDAVDDEDDETPAPSPVLGGEADLTTYELRDAADTIIQEGDRDVEIGEITVEFSNGDAEISRIDVSLAASGDPDEQGETRPWNAFRSISLWVDGDKVAEKRIDRRSDYLNDRDGSVRFSGLNLVVREDDTTDIIVAVEVAGTVRGADTAGQEEWTLTLGDVRFFDADGVASTLGTTGADTAVFTIEEAGINEEVRLSLASANPSSANIVVDKTSATNGVTVFAFDLEARNGDIDMETIVVRVETPGASTTNVVNRAVLNLDGRNYTARSIQAGVAATALNAGRSAYVDDVTREAVWYLFDIDRNFVAEERDRVTARLNLDFRPTGATFTNYENSTQIVAGFGNDEKGFWVAEGARLLATADLKGAADGETHTLLVEGAAVEYVSEAYTAEKTGTEPLPGTISLTFEVTAIDTNVVISEDASDILYTLTGATETDAIVTCSGVTKSALDTFTINDGATRNCTLSLKFTTTTGFVKLTLDEVGGTPVNDVETKNN